MVSQNMVQQDELDSALVGTRFRAKLQHFASVGSTNTLLLEAAAEGAPEGTVFLADEQTAGRGRGGHAWHSAAGSAQQPDGLYVSVLARPSLRLRDALWLSLAAGLAAQTAIAAASGVHIDIRWPNDLMLESRKLGGILVETSAGSGAAAPAMRSAAHRCSSPCCARWTTN